MRKLTGARNSAGKASNVLVTCLLRDANCGSGTREAIIDEILTSAPTRIAFGRVRDRPCALSRPVCAPRQKSRVSRCAHLCTRGGGSHASERPQESARSDASGGKHCPCVPSGGLSQRCALSMQEERTQHATVQGKRLSSKHDDDHEPTRACYMVKSAPERLHLLVE